MSGAAQPLPFQKVCGGGNDFVLIDARNLASPPVPAALARAVCRRGLSVGADGLVWIRPDRTADLGVDYYNADGSRAFCGNGTLCAARWACEMAGLGSRLRLATDLGVLSLTVRGERVQMEVPPPGSLHDGIDLGPGGLQGSGVAIHTGCPHLVVLDTEPIAQEVFLEAAPRLRRHPGLGEGGANVDFVTVEDPHRLRVRTWERGVEGETLASGTGCLAAALAAAARGQAASPVTCLVQGGAPLRVRFRRDGAGFADISLEGEARLIYAGVLAPDAFRI